MSEPIAERLSRFTPAAGFDRDALLFSAGRASARPNRRWAVLAGALAASQLATLLVFLWPHTPSVSAPPPHAAPVIAATPPAPAPDPFSWLSLRERPAAADGDDAQGTADSSIPAETSWHAFGVPPATLLN